MLYFRVITEMAGSPIVSEWEPYCKELDSSLLDWLKEREVKFTIELTNEPFKEGEL